MTEKELKELEKFVKENGYNDELKDKYLWAVIISTKYSTSYKHSFSYWYFCYCFKDCTYSSGISGKKFMYKIFKTSNRSRRTYQKTENS